MWIKRVFVALASLAGVVAISAPAHSWPDRPIKMIVPFAPGGGTDVVARLVAKHLSERLGQQVFIENRAGANGIIGMQALSHSPPDGYTIGASSIGPMVFNVGLYKDKLPYSPERDFTQIQWICTLPGALVVNPQLPVKSLQELISYAKSNPAKLNYASAGVGNFSHLGLLLFMRGTGTDMQDIPFNGGAPAQQAVLANNAQLMFNNISQVLALVEAGELRALGVGELARLKELPDVPAIAEIVPGFEMSAWIAISAPANLPQPIVEKLSNATSDLLKEPDIQEQFNKQYCPVVNKGPGEFNAKLRSDLEKWTKIIDDAHLRIQE